MPTPMNPDTSDFDKLMTAISGITSISSFDDILDAFGLLDIPTAQKYGIMFGCLTFTFTVIAVICLLVFGGSFKRMAEQAQSGHATIPNAIEARVGRPLLLERLLEAQQRMMKNYPPEKTCESSKLTNLTKMLINIAPDISKAKEVMATLVDEDADTAEVAKKQDELKKFIPDGYETNYVAAYRRCQDKPGGPVISGLPEARFEAYARAYAGCGIYTSSAYRRSYARMYEHISCSNRSNETKYRENWLARPGDIVGRMIRLEPMEEDRHLQALFNITCGEAYMENKSFEPNEVWGFLDEGPFETPDEMRESFVFQRKENEAGFAIVEYLTDRVIGCIILTNDDPKNLTISLEIPIVKPSSDGTAEQIEACFLLMDKLFAFGYRRIQISLDSMDTVGKKLPGRLGFTQEGMIPKDRVVKESNRDSSIYGMLNSDWDKGARAFLFKKLHGEKAMKADKANDVKEDELEVQTEFLAKKKVEEEAKKNGK